MLLSTEPSPQPLLGTILGSVTRVPLPVQTRENRGADLLPLAALQAGEQILWTRPEFRVFSQSFQHAAMTETLSRNKLLLSGWEDENDLFPPLFTIASDS